MRGLTKYQIRGIEQKYSDLLNFEDDDLLAPIDPMTYHDAGGDCLMHIAAGRNDETTIRLLHSAGMDINVLGELGFTPLHYARMWKKHEAADLLLELGARQDIYNELGRLASELG